MLLMLILVTVTGILVLVEHLLFGRMWAGNELARRVMGHTTVLVVIGVPALLGYMDFYTWLMACVVTVVAGGIVGAIEVTQRERQKVAYVNELRAWAEKTRRGSGMAQIGKMRMRFTRMSSR